MRINKLATTTIVASSNKKMNAENIGTILWDAMLMKYITW
jgi:hypothetical protein